MPGESDRDSTAAALPPEGQKPGANEPNPGDGAPPPRWGSTDRKRLLLWVAIAFIPSVLFVLALHAIQKPAESVFSIQSELPLKGMMAFFVVLATWIVSRMEKRPLDDYGIPPGQVFGMRFWEGLLWGFGMLSAILLALRWTGHFQIDSVALQGGAVWRYAIGWGAVFFAVAVHEEFAFRGYWLFVLARLRGFWLGALFTSVIFGVAHLGNPGENILGILQVVLIGLIFCLTIRRTGNLWFAVGFHAAWDWAETFFYGTPDSGLLGVGRYLNTSVQGPKWLTGGSAGPEGSVIALLVLLLFALLVHLRFPKAIYPDRPR
ncbi:MAG: type II CAAX endopeptidase family protein [Candidatus Acidiferrales bacterium]